MDNKSDSESVLQKKKISIVLFVGIIVLPFLFSWLTLSKRYGFVSRLLAMSWMGLFVATWILLSIDNSSQAANEAVAAKLGFVDASTMQQVQAKGWHTSAQYVSDETARAKKLGFSGFDELVEAEMAGFHEPDSFRRYKIEQARRTAAENASLGENQEKITNSRGNPDNFVDVINDAALASRQAENNLQKTTILSDRNRELCNVLPAFSSFLNGPEVYNWPGKIKTLTTTLGGSGVLAVVISKNIEIRTALFFMDDDRDRTLLFKDDPLFIKISKMKEGQSVVFSGRFFPKEGSCFYSNGVGAAMELEQPSFLFEFTDVSNEE